MCVYIYIYIYFTSTYIQKRHGISPPLLYFPKKLAAPNVVGSSFLDHSSFNGKFNPPLPEAFRALGLGEAPWSLVGRLHVESLWPSPRRRVGKRSEALEVGSYLPEPGQEKVRDFQDSKKKEVSMVCS